MGRSRTHETRPHDTRARDPRGHWHTGGGTSGASGDTGHVLGSAAQGPAHSPQREGGKGRLWLKSARGSKGSPAPGQGGREKLFTPLREARREPRRCLEPSSVPSPVPHGCGWAHRLKAGSPTSGTCTSAACPGPTLLIPVPGTGSAQQRRKGEDRERDRRGAASRLSTLGTEPALPHRSKALGEDRFSWQRIRSRIKGKAGKSLQGRASPCTPGDWALGNPSCPRAHKWHHQVGKEESPGQHREGERPLQSLSHVWRRLLVLEGRAMTGAGLGHSTSHPTPAPVH